MPRLKPKIRDGLSIFEIDGEAIVYDRSLRNIHYLNHTAAVVLEICDGTGTIEELAGDIADAYETDVGEVEVQVRDLLKGFREMELLERRPGDPKAVLEAAPDERGRVRMQVPKST